MYALTLFPYDRRSKDNVARILRKSSLLVNDITYNKLEDGKVFLMRIARVCLRASSRSCMVH